MFQLNFGLVRDGKWYNYTEVKPLKGGSIAILDSADKSGSGKMLLLIKGSIDTLYTKDGDEYTMTEQDYKDLKFKDGWKISREQNKLFSKTERPVFDEYFFCPVCSSYKNEKYTKVVEDWQMLIDKGIIDDIYCESPDDFTWKTALPVPIEISGTKQITEGSYSEIIREHLSIGQVISLSKNKWANESEANMIFATWDEQIKSVTGMPERELNILKRNNQENFCKKYITDQDNIEAMSEEPEIGLSAKYRKVNCSNCSNEIGGSLDFTNFFHFLSAKKLNL